MNSSIDGTATLLDEAEAAVRIGEYERALELCATAEPHLPDSGRVWRIRALAELQLAREVDRDVVEVEERRMNAVVAARRAVELEPAHAENHYVRALSLQWLGQADALRALDRAAALAPRDTRIDHLRERIDRARAAAAPPRRVHRPTGPRPTRRAPVDTYDPTDWGLIIKILVGIGTFVVGLLVEVAISDTKNNQERTRPTIPSAVYDPWATTYRPITIPPSLLRPQLTTRAPVPGATVAPGAVR
ncbi:tetratricopeptide repeat protein [Nocardia crassostreae]|uniref:tetratricopeptide repeat protein n=1 Tax=Nocardia crassostreae TaxID=53428 RepID=UPI00083133F6|nr:hypothetical protein [Nocardia crassostreae]